MTLKELAHQISNCQKCRLWEGRTKAVPGEGAENARLFFIGEGPGREEDEIGRPFVGRSGKVLRATLKKYGIEPEDCFITSIVKCRPPNNRAPKTDEVSMCTKLYLHKQIEAINPDLIILLGGSSANYFFPKVKIEDVRSNIIEHEGRKYFITYHPAAALRSPIKTKKKFEEDIKKISALISQG